MTIPLSVCIPTYERPDGLARALAGVLATSPAAQPADVEIVVSDNGGSASTVTAAEQHLRGWPGPSRHVVHRPSVGMVGNFNACWQLAAGEWVFILHDDDYLTGSGLAGLLRAVEQASSHEETLLLGVDVVDEHGHRRHRQVGKNRRHLEPRAAVEWLMSDSSSVRFPGMLVRRSAYEQLGGFDPAMSHMTDYDMWLRLFARSGVTLVPEVTSAYVVHTQAATEDLFSPYGMNLLHELFRRVGRTGLIEGSHLRTLKRDYVHKFLLAGTIRRLRRRQWDQAAETFSLLQTDDVAALGWSPRWGPLRMAVHAVLTTARVWSRGRSLVAP